MIDSHVHLCDDAYLQDWESVAKRALDAGVGTVLNTGANIDMNKRVLSQCSRFPGSLKAVIGLSPHDAGAKNVGENLKFVEEHAGEIVAIGEIGLEYHHFSGAKERELQKSVLELQLQLAEKLSLPVVVHCREAFDDLFLILGNYPKQKVLLHCFLSAERSQEALSRGWLLSVPTFLGKVRDNVINSAPPTSIVSETDSPFFGGGRRNEPANVKESYERVAKLKGLAFGEVEGQIDSNARKFFNI